MLLTVHLLRSITCTEGDALALAIGTRLGEVSIYDAPYPALSSVGEALASMPNNVLLIVGQEGLDFLQLAIGNKITGNKLLIAWMGYPETDLEFLAKHIQVSHQLKDPIDALFEDEDSVEDLGEVQNKISRQILDKLTRRSIPMTHMYLSTTSSTTSTTTTSDTHNYPHSFNQEHTRAEPDETRTVKRRRKNEPDSP